MKKNVIIILCFILLFLFSSNVLADLTIKPNSVIILDNSNEYEKGDIVHLRFIIKNNTTQSENKPLSIELRPVRSLLSEGYIEFIDFVQINPGENVLNVSFEAHPSLGPIGFAKFLLIVKLGDQEFDTNQEIIVKKPKCDLSLTFNSRLPEKIFQDQGLRLNFLVSNNGKINTGDNTLFVYLSNQQGGKNILVKQKNFNNIAPQSNDNIVLNIDNFFNINPGSYFITAEVQSQNKDKNLNNNLISIGPITIDQPQRRYPDLKPVSMQVDFINNEASPTCCHLRDALKINLTLQNLDKGSVDQPFNIRFYLVKQWTNEQHLLGEYLVNQHIGGNSSVNITAKLNIPSDLPQDSSIKYILKVDVDVDNNIMESNEDNNRLEYGELFHIAEQTNLEVKSINLRDSTFVKDKEYYIDFTISYEGCPVLSKNDIFPMIFLKSSNGQKYNVQIIELDITRDFPYYPSSQEYDIDAYAKIKIPQSVPKGSYDLVIKFPKMIRESNFNDNYKKTNVHVINAADITISNLSFSPEKVKPNYDWFKVKFYLKNLGDVAVFNDATTFNIYAVRGYCSKNNAILLSTYRMTIFVEKNSVSEEQMIPIQVKNVPGLYYLGVEVIPTAFEFNKSNNFVCAPKQKRFEILNRDGTSSVKSVNTNLNFNGTIISQNQLPDLIIVDLYLKGTRLYSKIKNIGKVGVNFNALMRSKIMIYVNNKRWKEISLNRIDKKGVLRKPNKILNALLGELTSKGRVAVKVILDYNRVIKEINEKNNVMIKQFNVRSFGNFNISKPKTPNTMNQNIKKQPPTYFNKKPVGNGLPFQKFR